MDYPEIQREKLDPDGEQPCEIETSELREIIDLWLTENERLAK